MKKLKIIGLMGLALAAVSLPAQTGSAPPGITVAQGERLLLELETSIHTRTSKKGDAVSFRTIRDIRVDEQLAIPAGSTVGGKVTKAKRAGRIAGKAEIEFRLEDIRLQDGTKLAFAASVVKAGLSPINAGTSGDARVQGDSGGGGGKAGTVLHGGAQGGLIGIMTGGLKGGMYGSAIGAGIGAASILLRRGPDVDLPRSTLFEARFDRPLSVPADAARRSAEIANPNRSSPTAEAQVAHTGPPVLHRVEKPQQKSVPESTERVPETVEEESPVAPPVPAPVPTETAGESRSEAPKIEAPVDTPAVTESPKPAAADAAPAPTSAFKLKVNVQLVQVDVVVRDRAGRPMDHLKPEDFKLFEDRVQQQIQTFSRDELPVALALVIDRSGSVAPYMDEIRRAAYSALSQLKKEDEVCLFSFAGGVERLEELTSDRNRIADRIATIRAGGGTNIVDALYQAVTYLGLVASDRRRAVILISDNQATTPPQMSEGQTLRLAMEAETVVYSIKTAGEGLPVTLRIPNWVTGSNPVPKIAEETGGEVINVAHSGSLDAALATAVARLKVRYTLGYTPGSASPGTYRKILVRLDERFGKPPVDYTTHARTGYYYPSAPSPAPQR